MDNRTITKSLIDLISEVIGGSHLTVEDRVIFFESRIEDRANCRVEPLVSLSELDSLVEDARDAHFVNEMIFCSDKSFEIPVLVARSNREPSGRMETRPFYQSTDESEGLKYRIGSPSKEYIVHVLLYHKDLKRLRFLLTPETTWDSVARTSDQPKETIDVFDLLNGQSRYSTIRIDLIPPGPDDFRARALEFEVFERLAASLIYQISFNTKEPIIEARNLDLLLANCLMKEAGVSVAADDIQPPRRLYTPELVYSYQASLSSDSPTAKFLSLYQILEYFYDVVVREKTVFDLRDAITNAGFSHQRDRDIEKLIDIVDRHRKLSPNGVMSAKELDGLRLTLKKFVDLPQLIDQLSVADEESLQYFKTQRVPFVKADTTVDFGHKSSDAVNVRLADRIYKTRNAVVHGKSGMSDRYVAFRDEGSLRREIILVRSITEQIIEKHSGFLNLSFPF